MKLIQIYVLLDPRNPIFTPRYVGLTSKGLKARLAHHIAPSTLKFKNHRTNWIKSLLKDGIKPIIYQVDIGISWDDGYMKEQKWIECLKQLGFNLTNGCDGGKGSYGFKMSRKQKRLISVRKGGISLNKIKQKRLDSYIPDEEKLAKRKKAYLDNVYRMLADPTRNKKISDKMKLYNRTPEQLEKLAEARRRVICKKLQITYFNGEIKIFNSVKEFQEYSNISKATAWRGIKQGYLKKVKCYIKILENE